MSKKAGRAKKSTLGRRNVRRPWLISLGLGCWLWTDPNARAQEALLSALSLDSVVHAQTTNTPVARPPDLPHIGPVQLLLGAYSSLAFDDNINLSQKNPQSDAIIGTGLDLGFSWLATGQSELLLAQLHTQLLAGGVLPPRSRPSILRGPLTTFAAARRTVYSPTTPYRGKARLVLVDDPALDADANLKQRQIYLSGWESIVSELCTWDGPGNHYSMLRPPNVSAVAKWWWNGLSRAAL